MRLPKIERSAVIGKFIKLLTEIFSWFTFALIFIFPLSAIVVGALILLNVFDISWIWVAVLISLSVIYWAIIGIFIGKSIS